MHSQVSEQSLISSVMFAATVWALPLSITALMAAATAIVPWAIWVPPFRCGRGRLMSQ